MPPCGTSRAVLSMGMLGCLSPSGHPHRLLLHINPLAPPSRAPNAMV